MSGSKVGGYYYVDATTYHAFLYDGAAGTYLDIDPPGAISAYAADVSGDDVVGAYKDASGVFHGFLYDGSGFTMIDFPGAISSKALGVSPYGIVGTYTDANGDNHAFHATAVPEPSPGILIGVSSVLLGLLSRYRKAPR